MQIVRLSAIYLMIQIGVYKSSVSRVYPFPIIVAEVLTLFHRETEKVGPKCLSDLSVISFTSGLITDHMSFEVPELISNN